MNAPARSVPTISFVPARAKTDRADRSDRLPGLTKCAYALRVPCPKECALVWSQADSVLEWQTTPNDLVWIWYWRHFILAYTRNDIVKIIAACEEFGRTSYERRRAHAMVLVSRRDIVRQIMITMTSSLPKQ
jgi:hypothetical protein